MVSSAESERWKYVQRSRCYSATSDVRCKVYSLWVYVLCHVHVIPSARRKLTTCWNPTRHRGGSLGQGPTGRRVGRAADPEHMSFHAANLAPMQLLSYPKCLIKVKSINRHGMALLTRCHMSALFLVLLRSTPEVFSSTAMAEESPSH